MSTGQRQKVNTMKKIFILLFLLSVSILNSYSQTAEEFFKKGKAKFELKDHQGAISDYTKAIEINPKYKMAFYNRGYTKYELKDYKGAITDFNKAIEIDPSNERAYFNRAVSKFSIGQKDSGCMDLKKALELGFTEAEEPIKTYCTK